MTKLLLASGNPGKIRELRALLQHLPLTLVDINQLGWSLPIEELEDGYAPNARTKALTYAQNSGIWTLADDSGLEVDALGGAPGPRSARMAGPGRSDADRRKLLLELLQMHPRPWRARFCCTIALASPMGDVELEVGTCEGEIIPEERGSHGFGYDPIFQLMGGEKTMAELTTEEKNHVSHRARAVKAILPALRRKLLIP
jgi:XTP/dITP diphosphohydrolase